MSNNEKLDTASAPVWADEIVVGVDDSPAAAAALRWAAEQSRVTGARLRVVHAWQMNAFGAAAVVARAARFGEAASAVARARATRWVLDALGAGAAEVRWQLDIVEASPGPALVGRSSGTRLLVLGTQEHTGLHRAVPGSVTPMSARRQRGAAGLTTAPVHHAPTRPDSKPRQERPHRTVGGKHPRWASGNSSCPASRPLVASPSALRGVARDHLRRGPANDRPTAGLPRR